MSHLIEFDSNIFCSNAKPPQPNYNVHAGLMQAWGRILALQDVAGW